MNVLTEDDISFLRDLANELKTQDTDCQRKPVFIQVREPIKQWGVDIDYADGVAVFINDSNRECPYYTIDEAKEYLENDCEIHPARLLELTCFDDIERFCEEEGLEYFIGGFNRDNRFHQAFLTFSAYEQHMSMNRHNYAHGTGSWLDSFYRNPQMERLLEIVEKFADVKSGETE